MFQDLALPLSPGRAFLLDQIFGQVRVTGEFQDMKKSLHLFILFSFKIVKPCKRVFLFKLENAHTHT